MVNRRNTMSIIYSEVGNRIRKAREKLNLSRESLSESAEISSKFLYEIETGQKGFSSDILYRISKSLNISSDYILNGYPTNDDNIELSEILNMFSPEQIKEIIVALKSIYKISIK